MRTSFPHERGQASSQFEAQRQLSDRLLKTTRRLLIEQAQGR
ncbi:hypothetical protein [Ectopseudomonas guguanensis]|jgi:hypothetical protein|nr:hypothetical protein [Pseudomonas guguanensis]MDR8014749.1 hypothetical protein [Pseudomonas guguanensis]